MIPAWQMKAGRSGRSARPLPRPPLEPLLRPLPVAGLPSALSLLLLPLPCFLQASPCHCPYPRSWWQLPSWCLYLQARCWALLPE